MKQITFSEADAIAEEAFGMREISETFHNVAQRYVETIGYMGNWTENVAVALVYDTSEAGECEFKDVIQSKMTLVEAYKATGATEARAMLRELGDRFMNLDELNV